MHQVTENGRKAAVPNDAVVLFDWGDVLGESPAYVYDGCEVSQTTFTWTARELFIAPRVALVETDGSRRIDRRQYTISFPVRFCIRSGRELGRTTMTLMAGKRCIE